MKKLIFIILFLFIIFNLNFEKKEIRIRILASSNTFSDQQDKKLVKEILINNFKEYDYQNADNFIENNLNKIKDDLISNLPINLKDKIKVEYLDTHFPPKSIDNNLSPSGYYKTLLITIDKGQGNNWWTVLYPEIFGIGFEDFGDVKCRSYFYDKWINP